MRSPKVKYKLTTNFDDLTLELKHGLIGEEFTAPHVCLNGQLVKSFGIRGNAVGIVYDIVRQDCFCPVG